MLVIKIHLLVSVKYWLNLFKEKLSQIFFFLKWFCICQMFISNNILGSCDDGIAYTRV